MWQREIEFSFFPKLLSPFVHGAGFRLRLHWAAPIEEASLTAAENFSAKLRFLWVPSAPTGKIGITVVPILPAWGLGMGSTPQLWVSETSDPELLLLFLIKLNLTGWQEIHPQPRWGTPASEWCELFCAESYSAQNVPRWPWIFGPHSSLWCLCLPLCCLLLSGTWGPCWALAVPITF